MNALVDPYGLEIVLLGLKTTMPLSSTYLYLIQKRYSICG